jgi:hypothetical protein
MTDAIADTQQRLVEPTGLLEGSPACLADSSSAFLLALIRH